MLSKTITDLPVQDSTLRQEILKRAFETTENDSVRGIYAQARSICRASCPALQFYQKTQRMHRK